MLTNIPNEYNKSEGYPVYDITRGFAFALDELDEKIETVKKQQSVRNLTGLELEKVIEERTGLTRKTGVKAVGRVKIVSGQGTVLKTDLFATENDIYFQSLEAKDVTAGDYVLVECTEGGLVGNVGAGLITVVPKTITGISQVTNDEPTSGGYDTETDESLLERYFDRLRNPVNGVNANQYITWANSVAGVGGARCIPIWNGKNTVKVIIIGNDYKPASENVVKLVQDYIDPNKNGDGAGVATIGAVTTVVSAKTTPIKVTIKGVKFSGDVNTLKVEIKDTIDRYIRQSAFNTDYVSIAKIGALIIDIDGVTDFKELKLNDAHDSIQIENDACGVLSGVWYE
nr:MAG TPA: Baseplate J like protein [Caudoviricetes sp.]